MQRVPVLFAFAPCGRLIDRRSPYVRWPQIRHGCTHCVRCRAVSMTPRSARKDLGPTCGAFRQSGPARTRRRPIYRCSTEPMSLPTLRGGSLLNRTTRHEHVSVIDRFLDVFSRSSTRFGLLQRGVLPPR
jgi:hypothetical protein